MQWFRNRIRNQMPWFRVDVGTSTLEGYKGFKGALKLHVRNLDQEIVLNLDRDIADKISEWMMRNYPHRGNNVVQITRQLSILPASADTSGSPSDPTG